MEEKDREITRLCKELETVYQNLTNVQERCGQLLFSQRAATPFLLGKDNDNDPRDCVLVARQYVTSPEPTVHQWGVFIVDYRRGPYVDDTDEKGRKRRQFDTQQDALAYGWKLLEEIRA